MGSAGRVGKGVGRENSDRPAQLATALGVLQNAGAPAAGVGWQSYSDTLLLLVIAVVMIRFVGTISTLATRPAPPAAAAAAAAGASSFVVALTLVVIRILLRMLDVAQVDANLSLGLAADLRNLGLWMAWFCNLYLR